MDVPNVVAVALAVAALLLAPRLLLDGVGLVGDGIAQLFVPPDRTLGWPHGVQEGDDPWGWREPVSASFAADTASAGVGPELGVGIADLVDVSGAVPIDAGALVVPVAAVHR